MINKQNFVSMMNALDEAFNGDFMKGLDLLGCSESSIDRALCDITNALDRDVDPDSLAEEDEMTSDCGSYLFDWLLSKDNPLYTAYPTAGSLFDYISRRYSENDL